MQCISSFEVMCSVYITSFAWDGKIMSESMTFFSFFHGLRLPFQP